MTAERELDDFWERRGDHEVAQGEQRSIEPPEVLPPDLDPQVSPYAERLKRHRQDRNHAQHVKANRKRG